MACRNEKHIPKFHIPCRGIFQIRNPNTLYLVFNRLFQFHFSSTFCCAPIQIPNRYITKQTASVSPFILVPWPEHTIFESKRCQRSETMKFWKILSNNIEQTLPDWRDKFLSYKDLKKQLKRIAPKDADNPPSKRPRLDAAGDGDADGEGEVTKEVNDFLKLLEVEIEKFNAFFVEKEEEYIIKWKELQDRVASAKDSNVELMSVGREIVDFHGEMVLLENYSALNYTGLVKIIKKYDKRTGALLRLPFIQDALNQPFFKIDVLNNLVKECEVMLSILFPKNGPPGTSLSISEDFEEDRCGAMTASENKGTLVQVPKELTEIENMENIFIKLTTSALHTLEEIRGGSSTVSIYSLPPLHNKALVED